MVSCLSECFKSLFKSKIGVAITLLFFSLCSLQSFAQQFRLGLSATPSMAWLKSNSEGMDSEGSRFGFAYGVITDYVFTENYSLGSGVNVAYKGGGLQIDSANNVFSMIAINEEILLQTIEIPLTLKMKTNQIGHFKYYGMFGFGANFTLKANADESYPNTNLVGRTDRNIYGNINNFSASLIIGAGIEFPLTGNTSLTGGILFNNGFTDIVDGDPKAIANSLGINVGILF